jgi:spore coat polysaccharide biosynthesis protein SpsF
VRVFGISLGGLPVADGFRQRARPRSRKPVRIAGLGYEAFCRSQSGVEWLGPLAGTLGSGGAVSAVESRQSLPEISGAAGAVSVSRSRLSTPEPIYLVSADRYLAMGLEARIFVQARMGSSRFPGKVLAPLDGTPIIDRVLEHVADVLPADRIVVLTSERTADDPLDSYLDRRGVEVFRGDHTDVYGRFKSALEAYPCDGFFRVCGDSPFLEPALFERALEVAEGTEYDLITSKESGGMPFGKDVEFLSSRTFSQVPHDALSDDEREHVTSHFYNNPDRYEIRPVPTPDVSVSHPGFCVDEVTDLKRLESALDRGDLEQRML